MSVSSTGDKLEKWPCIDSAGIADWNMNFGTNLLIGRLAYVPSRAARTNALIIGANSSSLVDHKTKCKSPIEVRRVIFASLFTEEITGSKPLDVPEGSTGSIMGGEGGEVASSPPPCALIRESDRSCRTIRSPWENSSSE
jgi:hypothetical protein